MLSGAKVLLLERTAQKVTRMEDPLKAANYARGQSLLRFLLTGLVLGLPAFAMRWGVPAGLFWGAAAGALVFQLAVYALKITTKEDRR